MLGQFLMVTIDPVVHGHLPIDLAVVVIDVLHTGVRLYLTAKLFVKTDQFVVPTKGKSKRIRN